MKYKYQGYLSLWKISSKRHGSFYVNAFTEEEAIKRSKEFIKDTPMYCQFGEDCFENLETSKDISYPFVLI